MSMQEYYIRTALETEARGPFNIEQLSSLAENGQLTSDTYYYDAGTEQWTLISANGELFSSLFPEKKKLRLSQTAEGSPSLTPPANESRPPITVDDMLAAAQGRTADTKSKADPKIAMARAAWIGSWGCVLILAVCAAGEILPSVGLFDAFSVGKLKDHPLLFLGAIDVLLAVLLGLGVTDVYPIVRFRAALGAGFVGFLFYAQGATLPILHLAAGAAGLFLCTISLNTLLVLLATFAGVAGMAGVAYRLLS